MTPEDKDRIKAMLERTAETGYMINKVVEHCLLTGTAFENLSEETIFDIVTRAAQAFVAKHDKSDAMFEAFIDANT